MNFKTKLLLSAMAVPALMSVSAAQAQSEPPVPVTQTILPQSNNLDSVIQQIALNLTEKDSEISISLEGQSTQFSLNQFDVIGAGTGASASFATATKINDPSIVVSQSLVLHQDSYGYGSGGYGYDYPGVIQGSSNQFTANVDPNGSAVGDIAIRGMSQIGINQLSVASVEAVNQADVLVQQNQQYPTSASGGYGYEEEIGGLFAQYVDNSIIAELDGNGSVVIDGAYTTGTGDATKTLSSTQYGANSLNNAYVTLRDGGSISLGQDAGFDYYSDEYYMGSGGYYYSEIEGGYSSSISNEAVAYAVDMFVPAPGPGGMPAVVFDPAVRNLDQIAMTSVNTLNVQSSEAFQLYGSSGSLSGGYSADSTGQNFTFGDTSKIGYYNSSIGNYTNYTNYTTGIAMQNFALAANGENEAEGESSPIGFTNPDGDSWGRTLDEEYYYGGYGDSVISNVSQTIALSANTVNVVGELKDGSTTERNPAGTLTLGFADTNNAYSEGFVQDVNGEVIIVPGFLANPLGVEYSAPDDTVPYNDHNLGNAAVAVTGTGNASVNGVDQLQAVTFNSFSTTGGVTGASSTLPFVISPEAIAPDLAQKANDGAFVELENVAAAFVTENGNAAASGNQTLAFTLNSASVGGNASGTFVQDVGSGGDCEGPCGIVSSLGNSLLAVSNPYHGGGSVTIGNPTGSVGATAVSQTVISSVNTLALGGATDFAVFQNLEGPVNQAGVNVISALAPGAVDAANISQTVLNRLNTISANVTQN